MKEMQKWHCKQKSAFETNRRAPLLSRAAPGLGRVWARGPKATPLEYPFMSGRLGPTLHYCLTVGSGRKWEAGNARGQTRWAEGQRADPTRPAPAPVLCQVPAS